MPYILQERRDKIDKEIDGLSFALALLRANEGDINYTITRILYYWCGKGDYASFNKVLGILEAVKQEFYRRMIAPYEDMKKEANGDVYGGAV